MKRLAAAALQREGEVEGAYELVDLGSFGDSSKAAKSSPTFSPRGTRAPHEAKGDMVAVDPRSPHDHIWLVHHELAGPAQMKRFATVAQFAFHARELTSSLGDCAPITSFGDTPRTPQLGIDVTADVIGVRRGRLPQSCPSSRSSSSSSIPSRSPSRLSRNSLLCNNSKLAHYKPHTEAGGTAGNLTRSFWLDVQTSKPDAIRDVLALFPVHPITVEEVIDPESYDNLEAFTALNYVFMNIGCNQNLLETHHYFNSDRNDDSDKRAEETVVCSVICFEDWIITIHASPFAGLAECVKKIQADFNLRRGLLQHKQACGTATPLMTASWVLATLTDFVVQTFLPDPTVVLAEVDRVDEMVLLASTQNGEQSNLLRRVGILRWRISTQRALLFKKEQLLQQLLMPVMRTSFVSSQTDIAERYKHTLLQVIHIAERLDSARDILNQANMNFVSAVTMRMSRGSTRMDFRIQVLTQVATIFFPLQLIGNIFAMNVMIPLQNVENMNPFWGIVGVMGLWLVVCLIPTFLEMRHGTGTGRAMLDVDD